MDFDPFCVFVCWCVSRFVACDRNYETTAKSVIVNVHSEVLQIENFGSQS